MTRHGAVAASWLEYRRGWGPVAGAGVAKAQGRTYVSAAGGTHPRQEEGRREPYRLFDLLNKLHYPGSLYARARGSHSAGLSDGVDLLVQTEDVGRHNTIDKLLGACLIRGIETRDRILLATGR